MLFTQYKSHLGGHSKSTFVVQGGGGGSLKSELKRIGRQGVKPICTFALWKKLPDFQMAGKVLPDKLLGSC